jgi:multidrug efflux pump subunit AcrA (membrane-fusion protein)
VKRLLRRILFWAGISGALAFSIFAFVRGSATSGPAEPADPGDTPAVVFGYVEPVGRGVFVCPPATKRVVDVRVAEGDSVEMGQVLCSLDSRVESREVELARARVKSAEKKCELSKDFFERQKDLFDDNAVSDLDFTSARIQAELDSANLVVARTDLKRAEAVLGQLELRAPIDGIVYKLDVRLGELLVAGAEGDCPIMLGPGDLWVRLYVESFWADRVEPGASYDIFNSETGRKVGTGEVILKAPYLTRKNFRTDAAGERFDTGYQEVVLAFHPGVEEVPVELSVYARIEPGQGGQED